MSLLFAGGEFLSFRTLGLLSLPFLSLPFLYVLLPNPPPLPLLPSQVPCEFIAAIASPQPREGEGEVVSNHDELMSNFFAQPDALAVGKTTADLEKEGVPQQLWPHKVFPGNKPSLSLLLPSITPSSVGALLALYEHRTAVEGFVWGINSFDQWGVELGKVLAKQVRKELSSARAEAKGGADGAKIGAIFANHNASTRSLLARYTKIQG